MYENKKDQMRLVFYSIFKWEYFQYNPMVAATYRILKLDKLLIASAVTFVRRFLFRVLECGIWVFKSVASNRQRTRHTHEERKKKSHNKLCNIFQTLDVDVIADEMSHSIDKTNRAKMENIARNFRYWGWIA